MNTKKTFQIKSLQIKNNALFSLLAMKNGLNKALPLAFQFNASYEVKIFHLFYCEHLIFPWSRDEIIVNISRRKRLNKEITGISQNGNLKHCAEVKKLN